LASVSKTPSGSPGGVFRFREDLPMPCTIAPFTASDYAPVHALWQSCEGMGLHDDCDSEPAIARYLARNPGLSFVARAGARIVGAVLAGHDGRRGYLHHLAVHPDARGQGLGRRLVETALAALGEQGIRKAHIFVFRDNPQGRAFWQACGWHLREDLDLLSKDIP
jgi:ribosomal protein S18 acetylase RimI-like enzyme